MEFLRYPHLITTFFNTCVFGPPKPFTVPSTWTWIGHPVSGLLIPTLRPIQTWFPFGSDASDILTSLALVTRRTVLQKVRHQLHSTASLSVTKEYLALGGGPPGFPQGFSCLVVLWILLAASRFRLPGFHRLRLAFPKPFVYLSAMLIAVRNPEEPGPSVWPLSRSLAAT